jgi:predicted nucleotide-binding protein (sugar kinase/HSP70/actin superfamily)
MHPIAVRFCAAAFRSFGVDAEALPVEDGEAFEMGRAAVRGGECLPAAVTIGGILKKLREIAADPSHHAFFMPTAEGPCRFGQYARLHRMILDREGFRAVPILSPGSINSYQGIPDGLRRRVWHGTLLGDILFKLGCRIRPYEVNEGETDGLLESEIQRLERALEGGGRLEDSLRETCRRLEGIPRRPGRKPLVGVVGEIYLRSNPFTNQDLIACIERFGAEAWLAPLSEWFLYVAHIQNLHAWQRFANPLERIVSSLKNRFLRKDEQYWYGMTGDALKDRHEPSMGEILMRGAEYVPVCFEGEAILTVGRTICFAGQGADLVVNCAPFGCMPGALTTALFQKIQRDMGIPVVNMFYDGEGDLNRRVAVFLNNLGGRPARPRVAARHHQEPIPAD